MKNKSIKIHAIIQVCLVVLSFLLGGLWILSDKYYLNKFRAPINNNKEYYGDDNILVSWNIFKELQA